MRIHELVWTQDRIDHIARHGVEPEEFEEVCMGQPLVYRTQAHGKNPVFLLLGPTEGGRFLACIVIRFPEGTGLPVTARPMTDKERRRYRRWRRP